MSDLQNLHGLGSRRRDFFGRDEFNKIFKRMLNEVEYPDAADFYTMTLDTFVRYWKVVGTDLAKISLTILKLA